jgi:hypothetical protein
MNNELSHLADGEAWKEFNKRWKQFAKDARNLRLGLATDGFNPFGNMNNSYSMWPVFVVPYNMPPWVCIYERIKLHDGLIDPWAEFSIRGF